MKLLIDMDGVVVNFIEAALAANGISAAHDDVTTWNFHRECGLSDNQFWAAINSVEGFWLGLKTYPWFEELMDEASQFDWHFCTTPSRSPLSSFGKHQWIVSNYGKGARNFCLTPQKHLLANPGTILIDDSDSNYEKFVDAGGHGILFPQPWNKNSQLMNNRMEFVRDQLDSISG